MNLVVHVLRSMGRNATTLLPFSLLVGLVFQDAAALLRPAVPCLAVALTTVTLARTDWPRVLALLRRPGLAIRSEERRVGKECA